MNNTKHAIVEGLKAATGAIDNGPALPGGSTPKRPVVGGFGPLRVSQGVGLVRCDTCRRRVAGEKAVKAHNTATGHRVFYGVR
jgi:hypothetical protein